MRRCEPPRCRRADLRRGKREGRLVRPWWLAQGAHASSTRNRRKAARRRLSQSPRGVVSFHSLTNSTCPDAPLFRHFPWRSSLGVPVWENHMTRLRKSDLLTTTETAEALRLKEHTLENM